MATSPLADRDFAVFTDHDTKFADARARSKAFDAAEKAAERRTMKRGAIAR